MPDDPVSRNDPPAELTVTANGVTLPPSGGERPGAVNTNRLLVTVRGLAPEVRVESLTLRKAGPTWGVRASKKWMCWGHFSFPASLAPAVWTWRFWGFPAHLSLALLRRPLNSPQASGNDFVPDVGWLVVLKVETLQNGATAFLLISLSPPPPKRVPPKKTDPFAPP